MKDQPPPGDEEPPDERGDDLPDPGNPRGGPLAALPVGASPKRPSFDEPSDALEDDSLLESLPLTEGSGRRERPRVSPAADFARFFMDSFPRLRSEVRKFCGDATLADDIVQESFLQGFRKWNTLRDEDAAYPWIRTLAFRKVADHFRTIRNHRDIERRKMRECKFDWEPDEIPFKIDIRRLVARLSDRQRQVLVFRYRGSTIDAIAEVLGVSPRTIDNELRRIRAVMREFMFPEEGVGS